MIKCIHFPDKTFLTKEEMFDELIKNEKLIISEKCSTTYKNKSFVPFSYDNNVETKGLDNMKKGYIYPIISTTRFFDSHKDVHFDNCFNKTVKEQQGKVLYCLDHELKYDSVLAWEKDIRMFVDNIEWSKVGKGYNGKTQALIFEIKEDAFRRKDVLEDIKNKVSLFQNSIRMQYITVKLGVNSQKKEHAIQKKYYDDNIDSIINKEEVEEEGFFWGIEELAIRKEGSLVVAGGSNSATAIQMNKNDEPLKDTQQNKDDSREITINAKEIEDYLKLKLLQK